MVGGGGVVVVGGGVVGVGGGVVGVGTGVVATGVVGVGGGVVAGGCEGVRVGVGVGVRVAEAVRVGMGRVGVGVDSRRELMIQYPPPEASRRSSSTMGSTIQSQGPVSEGTGRDGDAMSASMRLSIWRRRAAAPA